MTSLIRTRTIASARLPRLAALIALYRSRRALGALDAASLDDIGLSRDEARHEARRPFWDMPQGWDARRGC